MSSGTEQYPTPVVSCFVKAVIAFSQGPPSVLFEETAPQPKEVSRPVVLLLDRSGSMARHRTELCVALSELLKNTNADGRVRLPPTDGATGIVSATNLLAPELVGCDVIIMTDGHENVQEEPISVLSPDGNEISTFNFSSVAKGSPDYLRLVVDYLTKVCMHKLFLIGIGNDAKTTAEALVTRANCYVGLVYPGASPREITSVVRATRTAPMRLQPTESVIYAVSPEAQRLIDSIPEEEIQELVQAGSRIETSQELIPYFSLDSCREKFEDSESAVVAKHGPMDVPKVRAATLLVMASCDGKIPAAYFTAHSGILLDTSLKKSVNRMLSQLVDKKLLLHVGKTPDKDRAPLVVNGVKMPQLASIYKNLVSISTLQRLMSDSEFAAPQSSLRKRAREGSSSDEVETA